MLSKINRCKGLVTKPGENPEDNFNKGDARERDQDMRVQNGLEKGDKGTREAKGDDNMAEEISRKQRDDLERERLREAIDNWDSEKERTTQEDYSGKDQGTKGDQGKGQKTNKGDTDTGKRAADTENKKDTFDTQAQSKNVRS